MSSQSAPGGTWTGSLVTKDRLVRFGGAVSLALAVAFAIHVITADGVSTVAGGRLGGDWAPFRTAGVLASRDPSLILDTSAQAAAMSQYFAEGGFLPFANPPITAFLFIPGSWVDFATGYVVFVLILVAISLVAIRLTLDLFDVRDPGWRRVGYLGAMTFAPVFRAYAGAQNSTFTLLLLAAGFLLLKREHPWWAGVVLGGLWYKPQFAIPAIGLVLVLRHWRTAAAALATGVAFWAANALVFGTGWVVDWLEGVVQVTDQGNIGFSTNITVSPVEWVRWTVEGNTGLGLSLLLAAVIGLAAILVGTRHPAPEDLFPLASAALVLTAPHALVYELALLVPVIGSGLVHGGRTRVVQALGLWAASLVVVMTRHPVARIGFVLVCVAWWLAQLTAVRGRPDTTMRRQPALEGT